MVKTTSLSDFEGDKGRALILGQSGSGKTTLAGSVAEMGKTLYAYVVGEEGISSLRGESWSDNIEVVRIEHPETLREIAHDLAGEHDYKGLVLDSWSAMDAIFRRYLLGLPLDQIRDLNDSNVFMEQRDWGALADITMDVMVNFYSLASHARTNPVHVVMTSQVKEYEDEEDRELRVGAAVSKGCRVAVHACPDFILHCTVEEDPDSDDFDEGAVHRVILLPDERKVTKLHTERERAAKVPRIVGNASQRLTMQKFFKMMGVPT